MRMDYTKDLLAKGEERKRLTAQLTDLATRVADEIAHSVPVGTIVFVDPRHYKVIRIESNLGGQTFLAVNLDDEDYYVFDGNVGGKRYLHGDFGCPIYSADRDAYLHLVNNLLKVAAAFEAEEQQVIDALRKGFEALKAAAR